MAKRGDPNAKRKGENELQYRSRLAQQDLERRRAGEDVVTPERLAKGDLEGTGAKSGQVRSYRKRSTSSLARLCDRGVISDDQLAAAQEIAIISERIGRDVGGSTASLSGRVDCEGSGRDHAIEPLHRIRIERAYSQWRLDLPLPRQMVLDMVKEDHQLAAIASRHNRGWRTAVEMLKSALNHWPVCKRDAFNNVSQEDADEAQRRCA